MKKLILVRHGQYGKDDRLDDFGKRQMAMLAEKLKSHINGSTILLLSSVALRACDSAEVLGQMLNADFEKHDVLWSEWRHPENLPAALQLIRSKKDNAEVVVVITHLEYIEQFPRYFSTHELKGNSGFPFREIEKGTAWVIDCELGTICHVS